MNKKLLAAICASAMVLAACTACGDNTDVAEDSTPTETSAAEDEASDSETGADSAEESESGEDSETAAPINVDDIDFEDVVIPESGDAFLMIVDGQWYVKYYGGEDGDILVYDAGIAHIEGDGSYTVSVNVATKGAQFDIGGDPNGDYVCGGLQFAAVNVIDGTTLFPNMCIEITEIRIDGTPIEMLAKNYTSSDDGVEMRANIYNQWVNNFPDDAHTADGAVTGEFGEYSSQIVNLDDFESWSKIEVDFTVTGTNGAAAAADDGADDAETPEEDASADEDSTEE